MKKRVAIILFILSFVFIGASCETDDKSSYEQDNDKQEEIQKKLIKASPIPDIQNSVERDNVIKRAKTFDSTSKISYIYLLSYGKVVTYYPVIGKVSSLNSYLTPMEKLVDANGDDCSKIDGECYTVENPDIDGTYGENIKGIFFFTTEGVYVETQLDYILTDQPLKISTPVELVREVK